MSQPSQKAAALQEAVCGIIRSIPPGKVSTYGRVAEAAGYPRYHRQVVQILGRFGKMLPWYRVLGSGGQIKTPAPWSLEQRTLLEMEGVRFRGKRVDMQAHEHQFLRARTNARAPRRQT